MIFIFQLIPLILEGKNSLCFRIKGKKSVEMLEKEEEVGDNCVDSVQILTSLLAKVVHYMHPSLFKPPWG